MRKQERRGLPTLFSGKKISARKILLLNDLERAEKSSWGGGGVAGSEGHRWLLLGCEPG